MSRTFEITDPVLLHELLRKAEYGTLALTDGEAPYSVPVNFVFYNEAVYFHGSKGGRKMTLLKKNPRASFSIVEQFSVIPSYFSSTNGLACPASQFFKSIIIDGEIEIISDSEEKKGALDALMKKLQPEGNYLPFSDEQYRKEVNATALLKLNIERLSAKFKFGQHLSDERFNRIIDHLHERNGELDSGTIAMMKTFRKKDE